MKMDAGKQLCHKKPMHAPAIAPANAAMGSSPYPKATMAMPNIAIITVPPASPSRPSVRFTALERPAMRRNTKRR